MLIAGGVAFASEQKAKSGGTIVVRLFDARTKEPVSYEPVSAVGPGPSARSRYFPGGRVADDRARAEFTNLPAGSYQVRAGGVAYERKLRLVQVREGKIARIGFGLKRDPNFQGLPRDTVLERVMDDWKRGVFDSSRIPPR